MSTPAIFIPDLPMVPCCVCGLPACGDEREDRLCDECRSYFREGFNVKVQNYRCRKCVAKRQEQAI